jgi:hypothetical protein
LMKPQIPTGKVQAPFAELKNVSSMKRFSKSF